MFSHGQLEKGELNRPELIGFEKLWQQTEITEY